MKRILPILIYALSSVFVRAQDIQPTTQNVLHVATALNHLTVLEFHEPVTMAAVGSSDFQIERQGDKVFVKPTAGEHDALVDIRNSIAELRHYRDTLFKPKPSPQ